MNTILTFKPYFKSVIWGGTRIAGFKGLPSQGDTIGESWELSPMDGHVSVVDEGPYQGMTLIDLIDRYGADLLGKRVIEQYGHRFPLLIKFIDSNQDLSIQVHPDDALAAVRHNSPGKTEMWYSVDPTPDAYLYAGFSHRLTPASFREAIAANTLTDTLMRHDSRQGDVFFLPAGRVHSIGRGNFVLEIQQASDITYRIYDFGRIGADGKPRQLHVDEAIEATDFSDVNCARADHPTFGADSIASLAKCRYFDTSLIRIDGNRKLDLSGHDSFTIIVATKGDLKLTGADNRTVALTQGRTALLPATMKSVAIDGCGEAVVIFIP